MSPRNRLFKQYKKNPMSHSWQSYCKQRNKVTSLKRKEMKAFCQTASTNIKNPGEFWRQMKPLLPNCKSTTSIHFILVTGRKSSSCLLAELSSNNETRMRVSNHISDCILERPATGQVSLQETKISCYAFFWQNNMARHFIPRSLKNSSLHFSKSVFLSRPVLLVNRIEVQCLFSIPTITLT